MKLLKRIKGIVRFKTAIGNITLLDGENELSNEQFEAIKNHPMYESMVKTSGIVILAEEVKNNKSFNETPDEVVNKTSGEDGIDIAEIELDKQKKSDLVTLAESLEIETDGLSKSDLINAINAKKAE